jgi:hypothetical protein
MELLQMLTKKEKTPLLAAFGWGSISQRREYRKFAGNRLKKRFFLFFKEWGGASTHYILYGFPMAWSYWFREKTTSPSSIPSKQKRGNSIS